MNETMRGPSMPEGHEVRAAYTEIINFNGRSVFQAVTRPDDMSLTAIDSEDMARPDEECIETLNAIGLGLHVCGLGNESIVTEFRPVLQDTDAFVSYLLTIDTEKFVEDTVELQLISAVLREMMIQVDNCYNDVISVDGDVELEFEHIAEEILASFEKIDEALETKRLNPPDIYVAALESKPSHRLNETTKKYNEAETYVNRYDQLAKFVMARHDSTLQFDFE